MKSFLVVLITFFSLSVSGQNKERKDASFGKITQEDYALKVYDKGYNDCSCGSL